MQRPKAFTLLEIIISMVLLGILAASVVPATKKVVKRQKELELRRSLLEVRQAIDRFKKAYDDGLIKIDNAEQLGYPRDFDEMIAGMPLKESNGKRMRFLRRIPVDPITGEAEWGMRSIHDDPENKTWGRENLFDIYSLSDGVALDGTEYSSW